MTLERKAHSLVGACARLLPVSKVFFQHFRRVPGIGFCLAWFGGTRAVLWAVGVLSREVLGPFLPVQEPGAPFTSNPWLAVWGHWDTRWYLDIATRGYSAEPVPPSGEANYAFFPLYPLLMRSVAWLLGDLFVAGLVVSNVALIVASVLLYRLVESEAGRGAAEQAVKYLFLMPTGFVFSGVLTESLFLALSVAAFRAAQVGVWWAAGVAGGLAALTRPTGVLLVLPLGWLYFSRAENRRQWPRGVAALASVPAGLGVFMLFNWHLAGDPLAFAHIQKAWMKSLSNPVEVLLRGMGADLPQLRVGAYFGVAVLVLSFGLARAMGFPYFLVSITGVLIPLLGGQMALFSIPRYALGAWPLVIGIGKVLKPPWDPVVSAMFGLLQGFLMVFWSNGSRMVM
jgi:hypothetical protein